MQETMVDTVKCEGCEGSGWKTSEAGPFPCPACRGKGVVQCETCSD